MDQGWKSSSKRSYESRYGGFFATDVDVVTADTQVVGYEELNKTDWDLNSGGYVVLCSDTGKRVDLNMVNKTKHTYNN